MTDIIKRLQNLRFVLISPDEIRTVDEAAKEIEQLRAKLADPYGVSVSWKGYLVSGLEDSIKEVERLIRNERSMKTGETSPVCEKLP